MNTEYIYIIIIFLILIVLFGLFYYYYWAPGQSNLAKYKINLITDEVSFDETYTNIEELRDSIVWCLEHKSDIRKYSISNRGRKVYMNDKNYFEDKIEKIIKEL